jgi:hypothetical protein
MDRSLTSLSESCRPRSPRQSCFPNRCCRLRGEYADGEIKPRLQRVRGEETQWRSRRDRIRGSPSLCSPTVATASWSLLQVPVGAPGGSLTLSGGGKMSHEIVGGSSATSATRPQNPVVHRQATAYPTRRYLRARLSRRQGRFSLSRRHERSSSNCKPSCRCLTS